MAIQPYTSHSAVYTQTQTESKAFKTHFLSTTAEADKITKIVQIEDEGVIIHAIITSSATVSLILLR